MRISRVDTVQVLNFIKNMNKNGFDRVLEKIKILSLGDGKCSVELKVEEEHTNPMGGLHGGLSATLVDCVSSYALMSQLGLEIHHVSVDINMTYLKGAQANDEIVVNGNVVKIGKSLAFLNVEIKNKASGDMLVKGTQTKFLILNKES